MNACPEEEDTICVVATKEENKLESTPPPLPKPDLSLVGRPGLAEQRTKDTPHSEMLRCLETAVWDNRVDWALNAAGAGFVLVSGKYQLAAAVGGGMVSMAGLVWATANRDAQGAGAAFVGKQASNMGLAEAGSGVAKLGQRLGIAAVAYSIVLAADATHADNRTCMGRSF